LVQHSMPLPGFSVGAAGVRLFFVLSGFLITGILLREKDSERPMGCVFRRFYARRGLRIFPLFYLAILLAVLFGLPRIGEALPWHLLYATNFLLAQTPESTGEGYALGHFWSLAVEEQFYLFWPAVILLTPRRWLPRVFLGVVLSAPLTRGLLLATGHEGWPVHVLTSSCFDGLGLGALLALFFHLRVAQRSWWLRSNLAGALAALPLVGLMAMYHGADVGYRVYMVGEYFAQSLLFMWLVGRAAVGFEGAAGWLLSNRLITYLGQISYGIYVYQGLAPDALEALGVAMPELHSIGLLVALPAVTLPAAMLSWHLIERPINDMKRHFAYPASEPAGESAGAVELIGEPTAGETLSLAEPATSTAEA
jgi:peptidoglycan/LPS O-acetylase OafA/YrhL